MDNGPKKPVYEPPKLGSEMEKHGLVYDTAAVAGVAPHAGRQKRSRNRNKNNRRDHNRPTQLKENVMTEGTVAMNGTEATTRTPSNGAFTESDVTAVFKLASVMEHGFERMEQGNDRLVSGIHGALTDFNKSAIELTEGMEATTSMARTAAESALNVPKKLNEVQNLDNLKGDVRKAVIQTIVSAAIGGVVFLAISLFSSKPVVAVEVETPAPAPTPRRAPT